MTGGELMPDHPVAAPARQPTPEEWDAEVDRCAELEQQIKVGLQSGAAAWWATASALHEFDLHSGWLTIDPTWTKRDWMGQPEVGLGASSYSQMVRCWNTVLVHGSGDLADVTDLHPSKADIVFHALRNGHLTWEEALADIRSLSWSDVIEKWRTPFLRGHTEAEEKTVEVSGYERSLPAPDEVENTLQALYGDGGVWTHEIPELLASGSTKPRIERGMLMLIWRDHQARPEATHESMARVLRGPDDA